MGSVFQPYGSPKLVSHVQPGEVIEALSSAKVTSLVKGKESISPDPTKIFGYCRGLLNRRNGNYSQGQSLVERMVTRNVLYTNDLNMINVLEDWKPSEKEAYLVIGEIAKQGPSSDVNSPWFYCDELSK